MWPGRPPHFSLRLGLSWTLAAWPPPFCMPAPRSRLHCRGCAPRRLLPCPGAGLVTVCGGCAPCFDAAQHQSVHHARSVLIRKAWPGSALSGLAAKLDGTPLCATHINALHLQSSRSSEPTRVQSTAHGHGGQCAAAEAAGGKVHALRWRLPPLHALRRTPRVIFGIIALQVPSSASSTGPGRR